MGCFRQITIPPKSTNQLLSKQTAILNAHSIMTLIFNQGNNRILFLHRHVKRKREAKFMQWGSVRHLDNIWPGLSQRYG